MYELTIGGLWYTLFGMSSASRSGKRALQSAKRWTKPSLLVEAIRTNSAVTLSQSSCMMADCSEVPARFLNPS